MDIKPHLRKAILTAAKSNHRQYNMAAVLIRGGKIVAVGYNKDHLHAEHSCLNRAWRSDIRGASILVVRIRKDGSLGLAEPCELCLNRLLQAGIKKVYYSNDVGSIEVKKLTRMYSNIPFLEYNFINPTPGARHEVTAARSNQGSVRNSRECSRGS